MGKYTRNVHMYENAIRKPTMLYHDYAPQSRWAVRDQKTAQKTCWPKEEMEKSLEI